ncbi:helix-turn-helix domain-containing protein [Gulosibacter molinativorax]|uniref:XRE family transcriptional regulator n=1 Tax=Gulosibacter molinativorax TaxID=256821 RepID=A0ABT7CB52_9MICO|nr:XRE family transcriptional regulator [Gulosibacter molinativorax]MDJ1372427.1 XRE family transcriptional regulator [Gulosibacter molinativorax]QUY61199.1 Helix-turn-helix family protein [Gulosibacter molinativorax]
MGDSLAVRLRHARAERGMSLSELARRSGIGKGTVSELENGLRGARLDTLFALSTALEVPLGALVPDRAGEALTAVSGASVSAIPLGTWTTDAGMIEAYRATISPQRQHSSPHHAGVEETVTVVRGRVHAGVEGDERELGLGESIRYPGELPHTFAAVDDDAEVILLMHYPHL